MSTGVRTILKGVSQFEIVAVCTTLESALDACVRQMPDLVVIPLRLEGRRRGIELCRALRDIESPPKVLIYTSFASDDDVAAAFLSGADSYLHKAASPERLIDAVKQTLTGRRVWEASEGPDMNELLEDLHKTPLTPRETEVLALILKRWTNQEISDELFLGMATVKTHVRHLLQKLGARDRIDLFKRGGLNWLSRHDST